MEIVPKGSPKKSTNANLGAQLPAAADAVCGNPAKLFDGTSNA
jgi:hypothetical protein